MKLYSVPQPPLSTRQTIRPVPPCSPQYVLQPVLYPGEAKQELKYKSWGWGWAHCMWKSDCCCLWNFRCHWKWALVLLYLQGSSVGCVCLRVRHQQTSLSWQFWAVLIFCFLMPLSSFEPILMWMSSVFIALRETFPNWLFLIPFLALPYSNLSFHSQPQTSAVHVGESKCGLWLLFVTEVF